MTIRNPIEWSADNLRHTASATGAALRNRDVDQTLTEPKVRRISLSDLGDVLAQGWQDFVANRTDVVFICLVYPLAGLVIARMALDNNLLPLVFPLVSGFALIGPFAAAGLYEMSRRREQGRPVSWVDAFGVFASPSIAAIFKLALLMTGLFLLWMAVAMGIYHQTFGAAMPTSVSSFAHDVFATSRGWALILIGGAVGFVFALVALACSVVSFPLLLDRPVGIGTAVRTSIRAVKLNPVPMCVWGLIVAASLVAGAIPALFGLIVVLPVLGHATWHLYRKVVG